MNGWMSECLIQFESFPSKTQSKQSIDTADSTAVEEESEYGELPLNIRLDAQEQEGTTATKLDVTSKAHKYDFSPIFKSLPLLSILSLVILSVFAYISIPP
jgi:hypothetical protein